MKYLITQITNLIKIVITVLKKGKMNNVFQQFKNGLKMNLGYVGLITDKITITDCSLIKDYSED